VKTHAEVGRGQRAGDRGSRQRRAVPPTGSSGRRSGHGESRRRAWQSVTRELGAEIAIDAAAQRAAGQIAQDFGKRERVVLRGLGTQRTSTCCAPSERPLGGTDASPSKLEPDAQLPSGFDVVSNGNTYTV
jgi:hypothetical protein